MKKSILTLFVIMLTLTLTACGSNKSGNTQLEVDEMKKMVEGYSTRTLDAPSASITSHELIVTNSKQQKVTYNLPEEEFFVSIAPFVEVTHGCAVHSLTGCQGELIEKEFEIHIQDEQGNVIVDEVMTSFENGFIDLWLPRNQAFDITIKYDGKVAQSKISTFKGDNTCITTMQLKSV